MRSALFWILHRVECLFCTDVSGQPISPILKGQGVQEESRLMFGVHLLKGKVQAVTGSR
jgi:hypothetical protein